MTDRKDLMRRIEETVERRRDAYLAFLTGLLRFETVSGARESAAIERFRSDTLRAFDYLEVETERLGMTSRRYDELAFVAELPGQDGEETLGLITHLDVVPPGVGWTHPPFGGTIADGFAWGRGTQDDKGPAAAAFAAVDVLRELGLENRRAIRLLFGTLEETTAWPDIELLKDEGETPDLTLALDSAFPVVNGEKGRVAVRWTSSWTPSPAKPDRLRPVSLTAGRRANMVPGTATLVIAAPEHSLDAMKERLDRAARVAGHALAPPEFEVSLAGKSGTETTFEIVFHGKPAHGAYPSRGRNAAIDALAFLCAAQEPDSPLERFAAFLVKTLAATDGSGLNLHARAPGLGKTTASLGVLELREDGGSALMDVRFPFGLTVKEVERTIREVAESAARDEPGFTVASSREGRAQEPLFVDPEEHPEFIRGLQEAYGLATGREPELRTISGTTYAKAFPLAVSFGPIDNSVGDVQLGHEVDEKIPVERHLENIRIYAAALAILACDA